MPINIETSPKFEVLRDQFDVPLCRGGVRLVEIKEARSKLARHSASKRTGCYIFALISHNKPNPWYVGKAGTAFEQEVFNDGNCLKYAKALATARGRPVVLFVASPKVSGPVNQVAINKLESMLIAECGSQNPSILNQRKNAVYKTVIQGVMNSGAGAPSEAAQVLLKMTGRK